MKNTILLLIFLLATSFSISAQDDAPTKREFAKITLVNGNQFSGEILEDGDDHYLILTNIGEVKVKKSEVKKIDITFDAIKLKSPYRNFSDSYFVLPSARPVGKGNNHYKNFYIFFNQFNFGLSDNFSLGLGFESASIFAGETPAIYIAPKFSLGSNTSYFGIGTSFFVVPGAGSGGLAFVNYTYGEADQNFTLGASFAYANDTDSSPAIFNVSVMYPFSEKVGFVSEFIFGDFDEVLFTAGVRIKTRSGISIDAGIFRPSSFDSDLLAVPLLGLLVPLQKRKF